MSMTMPLNPDRQRERAAALANVLAPLIETHLASEAQPRPSAVVDPLGKQLLDACASVERAVDGLEQAMFTPAEVNARKAVLSAARKVRKLMRQRRERRNGR